MKQLLSYVLIFQFLNAQLVFGQDKELTGQEKVAKNLATFQSLAQMAQTIAGQNQMLGQMSIKQSQDSLFPNCSVLQTTVGTSTMCQDIYGGSINQTDAAGIKLYLDTLRSQKQNYQNDVVSAGNVKGYPKGVRCLQDNFDKMKVQLNDRIKQVDEFINKMKQTDAEFRAGLEKNELAPLRKLGSLLYGNTADRNIDFAALMNNRSCPLIMPTSAITAAAAQEGGKGGLLGIKTEFTPTFTNAQEFKKDSANIKKNIETNIAFVINNVDKGSLSDFTGANLNTLLSADSKAKEVQGTAFTAALTTVQQNYQTELKKIQTLVNKSTSENSEADKSLREALLSGSTSSDINQVLANWKSQKDLECIYSRGGGQASFQKILSTIADIDPRSSDQGRGSDTKQYGKDILNALTNSKTQTLEQRLAQVKALESQSRRKDFRIRLSGNYAGRASNYAWSVSELLASFQKDCKSLEASQTNSNGLTLKESYANLVKMKDRVVDIEANLVKDIRAQLADKLLTCGTNAQSVSKKNCNEASFNPQADFCYNQAVACFNTSYDCYKHLDTMIKTKQNEVNVTTERLKAKVDNYQKVQIALFNQMQTSFKATASQIEARFAAPFTYPTDVNFTQATQKFSKTLGIEGLEVDVNDPEATIGLMMKNLEALKVQITAQNKKAEENVEKHIADVKENYTNAIAALDKEISQCSDVYKQSIQAQAEMGKNYGEACQILGANNLSSDQVSKLSILGINRSEGNCENLTGDEKEQCFELVKSNNECYESLSSRSIKKLIVAAKKECKCKEQKNGKKKDDQIITLSCQSDNTKYNHETCMQLYDDDIDDEEKFMTAQALLGNVKANPCKETIAKYCTQSLTTTPRNDPSLKTSTNALGTTLDTVNSLLQSFGVGQ